MIDNKLVKRKTNPLHSYLRQNWYKYCCDARTNLSQEKRIVVVLLIIIKLFSSSDFIIHSFLGWIEQETYY